MKTKIVNNIAKNGNAAPDRSAFIKDLKNTHICPTGANPEPNANCPVVVSGENALMNICCETPAAINIEIPEPNPHLSTTSAINNINIPPKNNCKINKNCTNEYVAGTKFAAGANPPIIT